MRASLLVLQLLLVAAGCTAEIQGESPVFGSAGLGGQTSPIGGGGSATAGATASAGMPASGGAPGGAFAAGSGGMAAAGAGGTQVGSAGGGQAGTAGTGPIPSEGHVLYDASCKECHGEQGAGTQLGPELQHPVRSYAQWVVRNGRAQTTFPKPKEKIGADKLGDAQLALIFDYLSEPPKPTTGAALYADYCANCHGADARGGPSMRNILDHVPELEALVRGGKNEGEYEMRHDSMPAFSQSMLSDSELQLIRGYVDGL